MCMTAYLRAAELSQRGEQNLYDERFYPVYRLAGGGAHGADSSVAGMGPYLDDAYEYPPPFVLLPRAALAVTNDFLTLRALWFVLRALALAVGLALLGVWFGGREGLSAALLVPLLLASAPTMLDLQFGQLHATAIALAVAAMVAFDARRDALGGGLLAAALVAKIFPGLLLVHLAARRRWRAIAWTAAASALYALAALALLGAAPFRAFFSYQLPRIASGEAFSFFQRDLVSVSRNFSVYGLAFKAGALGVPGMGRPVAIALSWLYTPLLLALAWWSGRGERSRLGRAELWLALLFLASLRSPLAPSAYVVLPALVLLALIAVEPGARPRRVALVALAWIALMGLPPQKGLAELLPTLIGQLVCIALALWRAVRAPEEARAP
jgi:hypothetical protein